MLITKKNISFNVEPNKLLNKNDEWYCGTEVFWNDYYMSSYEKNTAIMQRFLSKDHSYIDIGAWIGSTVLFGAQLSKKCYAFEPEPIAFNVLIKNLSLNPNISNINLYNAAISDKTGKIKLGSNTLHGDSMSSMVCSNQCIEVDSFSLNDFIIQNNITDCNFIKIDIEGGEFFVLPSIKDFLYKTKPTLFLSLHSPWFEDSKEFFDKIKDIFFIYKNIYDMNYKKISLDDLYRINNFASIIATDIDLDQKITIINDKKVTVCLTSCNRLDLLKETLDSFFSINTYPIERFLITEDSTNPDAYKSIVDNYGDKVKVIFNSINLTPARCIDKMYHLATTEYLFHCEDDWKFDGNPNFIKDSMDILEERKDIYQIWIRHPNTHHHPMIPGVFTTSTGVWYTVLINDCWGDWCGFGWNPGLRRKSDYLKMFPNGFSEFILPNQRIVLTEYECNKYARKCGYRAASLVNTSCYHIGDQRSTY